LTVLAFPLTVNPGAIIVWRHLQVLEPTLPSEQYLPCYQGNTDSTETECSILSSPPVEKTCASPGTSNNRDVSSLTLSDKKLSDFSRLKT
jgi:hypothetical protein